MEVVKVTAGSVFTEIIDKVTFINYSALLSRASADDDDATPGYMFDDINKISYQAPPTCQQLADYLTGRLERPSARVKLKVIKIIFHVVKHGSGAFREALRRNDGSIKQATSSHGSADPLLGSSVYQSIRHTALEVLDALYAPDVVQRDEEGRGALEEEKGKVYMSGLGSSGSAQGKYEGFGSSPIIKEATVTEKVFDALDTLMHPTDHTADTIKSAFTHSAGDYEAVAVCLNVMSDQRVAGEREETRPHVPGRAGGGWDSDEERSLQSASNISTDSLDRMDTSLMEESSLERQLVEEFCQAEEWPVSLSYIHDTMHKIEALNCGLVIRSLAVLLQHPTSSNNAKTRGLLLIESLLRKDVVSVLFMSEQLSSALSLCCAAADTEEGNRRRYKAGKITAIINKLVSIKTG